MYLATQKHLRLLSGNSKNTNVDYLFATMQTMSKKEVYSNFDPNTFDTIIIDEAHRIGAKSYQEIMDYFKPKFWLGMSASPERTDDFDVYAAFKPSKYCLRDPFRTSIRRKLIMSIPLFWHYRLFNKRQRNRFYRLQFIDIQPK